MKSFKLYSVPCSKNRKAKKVKEKALERYSAHLDVKSMIESDLIVKHVFQFLFTKSQRMLLAHQKVRFLEVGSSTDDAESEELEVSQSKFLKKVR